METHINQRLVKGEDLNHHGTLFAGRTAAWFVECGFIAAASLLRPDGIVCLKIHELTFNRPVQKGEVVTFESRVVQAGRTRLVVHVHVYSRAGDVLRGFITFVHVDAEGRSTPHGLTITPETPEEAQLQRQASALLDQTYAEASHPG